MLAPRLDHHRGGAGAPLLLVHGVGHTWRTWRPLLPRLERDFDVLAVDLPGFGHSPTLPAGVEPRPEALADAVEAELDAAGLDGPVHVAGNSLGGWIALELARRGRARSVVAISPAGLAWGRERAWGRRLLRAVHGLARALPMPPEAMRHPLGRTLSAGALVGRPWRADPEGLLEQVALLATAPGFVATLPHAFGGQPRDLDRIDCPVLLLWGSRDLVLLPRQGRRFERLVPGSELRYIPGAGHIPMADEPDLVAEQIAAFAATAV